MKTVYRSMEELENATMSTFKTTIGKLPDKNYPEYPIALTHNGHDISARKMEHEEKYIITTY